MGAGGEPHSDNWDSYEVESNRMEVGCISINVDRTSSSHDSARGQKPRGELTGEYADKEIKRGGICPGCAKGLKDQKPKKKREEKNENESKKVKIVVQRNENGKN